MVNLHIYKFLTNMVYMEYMMYFYLVVGLVSLYFFNRFLNRFFEYRDIPEFWKFFFWGLSIYWVASAVLPLVNVYLNLELFDIYHAIVLPIGPALVMYAIYKIEEETRNV